MKGFQKFVCECDTKGKRDEEVTLFSLVRITGRRFIQQEYIDINQLTSKYQFHIPVGSIKFVTKHLNMKGVQDMYPIEVPMILRTKDYLGRDYVIDTFDKIPKDKHIFIKDVSKLKQFCGIVCLDSFTDVSKAEKDAIDNHLWLYSTELPFVCEYRFYVLDDKILTYALYDSAGYEYIQLLPDIDKVKQMVRDYSTVPSPEAYTLDIGVTSSGETYIIEVHPFASVGVYTTLLGYELPDMYEKGYLWYLTEYNKPLERFEFRL